MPAAAAQQLAARPVLGLCLAVALGLAVVWLALGSPSTRLAGRASSCPPSGSPSTSAAGSRAPGPDPDPSGQPAVAGAHRRRRRPGWRAHDDRGLLRVRAPLPESAFGAGTAIAVASGLVGYVVVLRGQVFAGDALSHVAFTGALAALAFGVDLRLGLYGGCVAFALLLAVLGRRSEADDTVVGSVFAWVWASAPCSSASSRRRPRGTGGPGAPPGSTSCSDRSWACRAPRPGGRGGGGGRGRGLVAMARRWCSPRSTRRSHGRGGCRSGPCRAPSSCCWA